MRAYALGVTPLLHFLHEFILVNCVYGVGVTPLLHVLHEFILVSC